MTAPCSAEAFPRLIDDIYTSRQLPQAGGAAVPMDIWIPRPEGELLYQLIRKTRPTQTIEIGLANGLSTLFITVALEHNGVGQHAAIDPFQSSHGQNHGVKLVTAAGFESRLRVIEDYSHRALPDLERSGFSTQFAFIDGAHLFDAVISDFLCLHRLLDVGGLMAFDDADWPSVRKALRYIVRNQPYTPLETTVIDPPPGRPSPVTAALRQIALLHPSLARVMAPQVQQSDPMLGLRGRCVVPRKDADDRGRDSQQIADFVDF